MVARLLAVGPGRLLNEDLILPHEFGFVEVVAGPTSATAGADQALLLEHPQVPGQQRPADSQHFAQLGGGAVAAGQRAQDDQPGGGRQGPGKRLVPGHIGPRWRGGVFDS